MTTIFHDSELDTVRGFLLLAAEKIAANAATLRMSMATANDPAALERQAAGCDQQASTAQAFADRIRDRHAMAAARAESTGEPVEPADDDLDARPDADRYGPAGAHDSSRYPPGYGY